MRYTGSVVAAPGLESAGLMVGVQGLSCYAACGIFLGQEPNQCPLNWRAGPQPLDHHRISSLIIVEVKYMCFLNSCVPL